ncbi:hypothetical protein BXZ70DRAFT_1072697 [Cristinia sonorae]|uniref:BRCT domain-containing protein n=1 Tax=Cristinia sonorae TaxID=1940300 RepID=A0A8K0XMT9_9AGAR|nr:hypothetical protein BXZ70DRAFT_1072697 [Cristinia sonorae]
MSYRRNKSAKVPNVKLRPAVPASSASSSNSRNGSSHMRRKDSGFDSDDDADMSTAYSADVCPRPFKGVLLCATGISDKTTLFKQAIELGAQSLSDLTDRVTHVIAEVPGSAKYKCALENGIPIMHPSWITESYKIWLRGDDVDFAQSVIKHRLPIFNDVYVTLTGISNIERRMEINKLITKHGGKYFKNLERPVKVTHVLCSREASEDNADALDGPWVAEQTDKMIYAHKFNDRGESDIKIVWEEWFWDCLEYGGRFNEDDYLVSKPRPKRKKRPRQPIVAAMPVERSIEPSSSNPHPEGALPAAPKPSFHTAEEEEETASVKRVPDVKLRIWGSIMGSRGFEVSGGKLVRSPSKSQTARPSLPPAPHPMDDDDGDNALPRLDDGPPGKKPAAGGSLLASFRRSKSFAPATKDTSTQQKAKQPFQRMATVPASSEDAFWGVPGGEVGPILAQGGADIPIASGSRAPASLAVAKESSFLVAGSSRAKSDGVPEKTGVFSGLTFRALGEARCASVKAAAEDAGGKLIDDSDAEVDYIIVRLVSGSKLFREEPDDSLRVKYRTECWLERCLYEERICGPDAHITFVPLSIETPIQGAEEVNLSFSGLEQSEGFWIRRLARALGISVAANFSRRTTHLLCPSKTGAKYEKALEWNIPVVDMSWVEAMARDGAILPESVQAGLPDDDDNLYQLAPPIQRIGEDPKGKGKAKETEFAMADITNNDALFPPDISPDQRRSRSRSVPLVPQEESNPDSLFGEPGPMLSNDPDPPSSPPLPPEDPATSPPRSRASSAELHSSPLKDQDVLPSLGRQPTLQEIREDMTNTRIPSSTSPSPIKIPPNAGNERAYGHSPLRISKEASKVLQDSITTLLGKRQPSEDDDTYGRGGKRARPLLRSKSRQDQPLAKSTAPPPAPDPFDDVLGDGDISMLVAEGAGLVVDDEQSMRVTYEDPNQNDERKRLLELLETQKKEIWEVEDDEEPVVVEKPVLNPKADGSKKGKGPTRRSSRVSGF